MEQFSFINFKGGVRVVEPAFIAQKPYVLILLKNNIGAYEGYFAPVGYPGIQYHVGVTGTAKYGFLEARYINDEYAESVEQEIPDHIKALEQDFVTVAMTAIGQYHLQKNR